jgi:hypothetical protein
MILPKPGCAELAPADGFGAAADAADLGGAPPEGFLKKLDPPELLLPIFITIACS